jgi:hypothetical protein
MASFSNRDAFEKFEFVAEVLMPLDAFNEYVKMTEELIQKEVVEHIKKYDELLKSQSEEDYYLHDSYDHEVKIHLQDLFYNSLFVSLYSFLERKMFELCKIAEPQYTLKIDDISETGIFQYAKYLKKVVGIDFEALNEHWSYFNKVNKLRNIIVHHPTTRIERTNQRKIDVLKSIDFLEVKERDSGVEFFIRDKQVILDLVSHIQEFLHGIYYRKLS